VKNGSAACRKSIVERVREQQREGLATQNRNFREMASLLATMIKDSAIRVASDAESIASTGDLVGIEIGFRQRRSSSAQRDIDSGIATPEVKFAVAARTSNQGQRQ